MNWFLRLFPSVRAYQAEVVSLRSDLQAARDELNREVNQNLVLQDRLEAALSDRKQLWDLTREAIQGERTAYQSHINIAWQKQGFGTPHPDAPHAPAGAIPQRSEEPTIPRRKLGSEMVAEQTSAFIRGIVEQARQS